MSARKPKPPRLTPSSGTPEKARSRAAPSRLPSPPTTITRSHSLPISLRAMWRSSPPMAPTRDSSMHTSIPRSFKKIRTLRNVATTLEFSRRPVRPTRLKSDMHLADQLPVSSIPSVPKLHGKCRTIAFVLPVPLHAPCPRKWVSPSVQGGCPQARPIVGVPEVGVPEVGAPEVGVPKKVPKKVGVPKRPPKRPSVGVPEVGVPEVSTQASISGCPRGGCPRGVHPRWVSPSASRKCARWVSPSPSRKCVGVRATQWVAPTVGIKEFAGEWVGVPFSS